jgi:hypothetical protein
MMESKYPVPGELYRHYKGGLYEVLFLAPHTETGETLVIYKSVLFGSYYARPLSIWNLEVSGEKRFILSNGKN